MPNKRLDIFDVIVFDGMTISDMVRETHTSIVQTDKSVEDMLKQIVGSIKKPQDVMMVSETLAKLMDTKTKKSENMIKLVSSVAKLTSSKIVGREDVTNEDDLLISYSEEDLKKISDAASDLVKLIEEEKKQDDQIKLLGPGREEKAIQVTPSPDDTHLNDGGSESE